jgi:hypothetical protein
VLDHPTAAEVATAVRFYGAATRRADGTLVTPVGWNTNPDEVALRAAEFMVTCWITPAVEVTDS